MAFIFTDIIAYLKNSKSVVIAAVDQNYEPDLRVTAEYSFDGIKLYFTAVEFPEDVKKIVNNDGVAILIQQENQVKQDDISITLYGKATRLTGKELENGRIKLQEKKVSILNDEQNKNIYQVTPELIKILDQSKKPSEQVRYIKP